MNNPANNAHHYQISLGSLIYKGASEDVWTLTRHYRDGSSEPVCACATRGKAEVIRRALIRYYPLAHSV